MFNLHFLKVSTENDNNFGYEKITIMVDNIPLIIETLLFGDDNLKSEEQNAQILKSMQLYIK